MRPVEYDSVTRRLADRRHHITESPFVTDFISTVLDGGPIALEIETIPDPFENAPNDRTLVFRSNDSVYEIARETLEKGAVTGPEYAVSRDGVTPDDVSAENVLPFSDLPYHDQWRLYETLSFTDSGGVRPFSDSLVAGYLDRDRQAESLLVAGIEQRFVEYHGQYIALEENGEGTAEIERMRFVSDLIATSEESAGEYLFEQHATDSSNLTSDGRMLVEKLAETETVELCHTVSGGESDSIEEANESERNAIAELESEFETTALADDTSRTGRRVLYIRHDGTGYELSWEQSTNAV